MSYGNPADRCNSSPLPGTWQLMDDGRSGQHKLAASKSAEPLFSKRGQKPRRLCEFRARALKVSIGDVEYYDGDAESVKDEDFLVSVDSLPSFGDTERKEATDQSMSTNWDMEKHVDENENEEPDMLLKLSRLCSYQDQGYRIELSSFNGSVDELGLIRHSPVLSMHARENRADSVGENQGKSSKESPLSDTPGPTVSDPGISVKRASSVRAISKLGDGGKVPTEPTNDSVAGVESGLLVNENVHILMMSMLDRHQYEQVEPVWKSYLYQMQLKAPKPQRVICTTPVPDKPDFYGKEFHGPISREAAEQLVMQAEGCYLTRESQRQPGTYALTFRFSNSPKNYRLYYDEDEKMHYVGEKRFDTIHDLVADGLITMYVDLNAKDYIEHMTVDVKRYSSNEAKVVDEEDANSNVTRDGIRKISSQINDIGSLKKKTFKASECAKEHNFKTQTYYGPHWCDFCRNFMWGLKAQGVRCQDCSFDCHKQCSSIVPADCSPDKKLVRRVFGVDLTTLIKAHNWRRPVVVDECVQEIEKRGLDAEGLYRVPGFADAIEFYKNEIDKDGVVPDISAGALEDINVVCGLLKLYFRMLPIPVIPFDLYDQFLDCTKLKERDAIILGLHESLLKLPPAHYETLKFFLRHLQRVTKFQDKNLMSSENLGIVFGPTLMRAPDHMAMQAVGNIPYQKMVVMYLIDEQDVLFSS